LAGKQGGTTEAESFSPLMMAESFFIWGMMTMTNPWLYQGADHTDQTATNAFYDSIAAHYDFFYRDWHATLQRESGILRRFFREKGVKTVLDASCGQGTQAIALAKIGFEVTAVDPSLPMLQKAREHARNYDVLDDITFLQADFLGLRRALAGQYDAVLTKGNALPHLISDEEISGALANFYALLRPGGTLLIGMRDFDVMLEDRPRFVPRQAHLDDPERDVILFDIWDWEDGHPQTVRFNTFIVIGKGESYSVSRHPVLYRALRREELESLLMAAGFVDIHVELQGWEQTFAARKPEDGKQ
jgi:glycine/sarcosine N-methyltransferase